MSYPQSTQCQLVAVIAVAFLVGCGDKPSRSSRERREQEAKKEYALEEARKVLAEYGGYDDWKDMTASMQNEKVTVKGLAMRRGAVHDFQVEFRVSDTDELRLTHVQANKVTLFAEDPPRSRMAKMQIGELEQAVELYLLQFGQLPANWQELKTGPALAKGFKQGDIWNKEIPKDPWGNDFILKYDDQTSKVLIYSAGPNGTDEGGADDDIASGY